MSKPRTLPIPRWVSPTHSTTTLAEVAGHSSFILVAISYAVEDFLHLRLLAIAGSSVMLFFAYFHPHGRVLWLPFKWNLLFIAINSYRVLKVQVDRFFAEQLSPLMLHTHEHHVYVMDKVDFARLMRLGTVEHFENGGVVVAQDQGNRYVRLVLRGELHVERDGQTTYMLHEGNFISESGLHAGLLLRGNINSCCSVLANSDDVVTVRWDRTELMQLLEIDTNIRRSLKAVMSWDIVSKLKSQRLLLAGGRIKDAEEWSRKRREQTVHRYKAIVGNMLAHPQYLNKRKEQLCKYRDIHHIYDSEHEQILNQMGWTLEDFDKGAKDGQVDEDLVEMEHYGWRWYAQELKLRILG
jgi:CRP-like cAMP-binding protein